MTCNQLYVSRAYISPCTNVKYIKFQSDAPYRTPCSCNGAEIISHVRLSSGRPTTVAVPFRYLTFKCFENSTCYLRNKK